MNWILPELCDAYPEDVRVAAPGFRNYGGRSSFGGEVVTITCFEDNSLVAERVERPGTGKVLIVDAGGSMRCGMLGDNLALKAVNNGWEAIVMYGCIRDVDDIGQMDIAVQALGSHPMKSVKRDVGRVDEPVTFAGVTFRPGNFAYGDNNGLLVSDRALSMPGS